MIRADAMHAIKTMERIGSLAFGGKIIDIFRGEIHPSAHYARAGGLIAASKNHEKRFSPVGAHAVFHAEKAA